MIPDAHRDTVCRPGAGEATCAYLTTGDMTHWSCAKFFPAIKDTIDARLAQGTMKARGDNCEGVDE